MTSKAIQVKFILSERGTWDVLWHEYIDGIEQGSGGAIGGAGYSLVQAVDKFKAYADTVEYVLRQTTVQQMK